MIHVFYDSPVHVPSKKHLDVPSLQFSGCIQDRYGMTRVPVLLKFLADLVVTLFFWYQLLKLMAVLV